MIIFLCIFVYLVIVSVATIKILILPATEYGDNSGLQNIEKIIVCIILLLQTCMKWVHGMAM